MADDLGRSPAKVDCPMCGTIQLSRSGLRKHQETPGCRAARAKKEMEKIGAKRCAEALVAEVIKIVDGDAVTVRTDGYRRGHWGRPAHHYQHTYVINSQLAEIMDTIKLLLNDRFVDLEHQAFAGQMVIGGPLSPVRVVAVAQVVREHFHPQRTDIGLAAVAAIEAGHPDVAWRLLCETTNLPGLAMTFALLPRETGHA